MKLVLRVDGERFEVDVDLQRGIANVSGRDLAVKVLVADLDRVELELAGESTVVEGWRPEEGVASEVAVNGELHAVKLERTSTGTPASRRPAELPTPPPVDSPTTTPGAGPGVALLPPMPGKVLEVRVRDGDHVERGSVVLVLEAMKMRNELSAPIPGTVREVRVVAGHNARAGEVLLRIVPEAES